MNARFAKAGPLFAVACAFALATPSCTRTQNVTFVLHVPPESRADAKWIEIGAYATSVCPSITQLSGGLPRGGVVQRIAFAADAPPPSFRLAKGTYAFASTVRNDQCEVVATGCTDIGVPSGSEIEITLREASTKGGKCSPGSACSNAECVPALGGDVGSGTGCTLEVVGAGPLESVSQNGSNVNRPAISAVADGFVISYSQRNDDKIDLTAMKVGFDGGPVRADENTTLPYHHYDIHGACADDAKTEGLGLLFDPPNASAGTVVIPRWPGCVSSPMLVFDVQQTGQLVPIAHPPPAELQVNGRHPASLVMSNHPLAPGGYVTAVIDQQALLAILNRQTGELSTPIAVGGDPPHERSWVASSPNARAVLTQAAGVAPAKEMDGSSGSDAPELRLQMWPPESTDVGTPRILHGRFGALALGGQRAVVVTSGSLQAPVELHVTDLKDPSAPLVVSGPPDEQGDTFSADVAISGDRIFVATVQAYGVSVLAFEQFSSTPKLLKKKPLGRDFRVKQFMGGIFDTLRDGYVAIAASQPYVGVVWMTGSNIQPGEEIGGWAVLACR